MKVEGTEKELKKMFEEKPKQFLKINEKTNRHLIFWGKVIGVFFLVMVAIGILVALDNDRITKTECSKLIKNSILNAEELNWEERLIPIAKPLIIFLIICLGISWIFHGVGFKVIG